MEHHHRQLGLTSRDQVSEKRSQEPKVAGRDKCFGIVA